MPKFPLFSYLIAALIFMLWHPTRGWAQYKLPKREQPLVYGVMLKLKHASVRQAPALIQLIKKQALSKGAFYPSARVQVLSLSQASNQASELKALPDFCVQAIAIKGVQACELNFQVRAQSTTENAACNTLTEHNPSLLALEQVAQQVGHSELQCNLFPGPELEGHPKGLSPFWAQEYTGTDLLRERMAQDSSLDPSKVRIQVWDSNYSDHGTSVSQLIQGPSMAATIPSRASIPVNEFDLDSDYIASYEAATKQCTAHDCPDYINNSMVWNKSSIIAETVEQLIDEQKVVFVSAAGNDSEFTEQVKVNLATKDKLILVSSFGPDGHYSVFSNYGGVTVAAPSDEFVLSRGPTGDFVHFGGTSGAAPQVTAALAAFQMISGYKLSPPEAKKLLAQTAIEPPFMPLPSLGGSGLLNTFAIGDIAYKLKEQCRGQGAACIKSKLADLSKLGKPDGKKVLADLKKHFPTCSSKDSVAVKLEESSCDRKQAFFKQLRAAALLNPEDVKLWQALGCIAALQNMDENAKFYESLSSRYQATEEEVAANPHGNSIAVILSDERWMTPELTAKLIEKKYLDQELAQFTLSKPAWKGHPELVAKMIENGKSDGLIAFHILSQPHWKRPELLMKLVQKGTADQQIAQYVLSQPQWQDHPEAVAQIIEKGQADFHLAHYTLTQAHWKQHPELVRMLLAKSKLGEEGIKALLSHENWKDSPELKDLRAKYKVP